MNKQGTSCHQTLGNRHRDVHRQKYLAVDTSCSCVMSDKRLYRPTFMQRRRSMLCLLKTLDGYSKDPFLSWLIESQAVLNIVHFQPLSSMQNGHFEFGMRTSPPQAYYRCSLDSSVVLNYVSTPHDRVLLSWSSRIIPSERSVP